MPGDVLVGRAPRPPRPARLNANSSCSAVTVAAMPCGLCAPSSRIVGALRTRSSRPGDDVAGEALADRLDVELPVGAGAEERLDRGERHRRVLRLVRAVQRQEDLVVVAAQALQGQHLAADGERSGAARRTRAPSRAIVAPTSAQRSSSGRGGLLGLRRGDHRGALVDDAGLGPGDVLDRVAEPLGVVEPDRRDHADAGAGSRWSSRRRRRARPRPRPRRPARRRTPRTPARWSCRSRSAARRAAGRPARPAARPRGRPRRTASSVTGSPSRLIRSRTVSRCGLV